MSHSVYNLVLGLVHTYASVQEKHSTDAAFRASRLCKTEVGEERGVQNHTGISPYLLVSTNERGGLFNLEIILYAIIQ